MPTEQENQEMFDFYQRLKNSSSLDFVELIKSHKHNKHDFPAVNAGDLEGILNMANGGLGVSIVDPDADRILFWDDSAGEFTFLSPGSNLSISGTTLNANIITVNAGEALTAGEVVRLQVAAGGYSTDGYHWVNGTVYACRAAANDTTYGNNIIGIMTSAAVYLGTGTCLVIGVANTLSGLTGGSKYYLDNYSSSVLSISQATQDTFGRVSYGDGNPAHDENNTWRQLYVPTSSRLDKMYFFARKNGGVSGDVTIEIKRGNTSLGTTNLGVGASTEYVADFTDIKVYKGELLNIYITNPGFASSESGGFDIAYMSTGLPYSANSEGVSTFFEKNGVTVSGASVYFKVYEMPNFGKLNTTAGTRKIKMGQALSATELAMAMQYADSIL